MDFSSFFCCFTLHGAPVFNVHSLTGRSQLAFVYKDYLIRSLNIKKDIGL